MIDYNKKIIGLSVSLSLLFCVSFVMQARAEGASLYLSPNSGTFNVGSTFDVSIFVNTGERDINAVRANLSFDPKKVQIANPTAGKSFISIWIAQPTYSNTEGNISFQGGVPTPGIKTSSGLVSTVTFRAIAPGETNITLLNTSKVLLDDGNGTDILNSLGRGVYSITILPPEGPKVFSSTHFDLNKWRKNNNPTFSWEKVEGVTDFSYSIDLDSQGVPDNISEGGGTSVSYAGTKDGLWYFHIKAKKQDVWGGTSHYAALIDTTPPASFIPEVLPASITTESQVVIMFMTTDALSGMDHYEVKLIDITPGRKTNNESFFVEASSPYKLASLETGKYMVAVRAFDKAGNWQDETIKIEVVPQGIAVSHDGFWVYSSYFSWWIIVLIILILIALIFLLIIYLWIKNRSKHQENLKRLKEKEKELSDQINKLEE